MSDDEQANMIEAAEAQRDRDIERFERRIAALRSALKSIAAYGEPAGRQRYVMLGALALMHVAQIANDAIKADGDDR